MALSSRRHRKERDEEHGDGDGEDDWPGPRSITPPPRSSGTSPWWMTHGFNWFQVVTRDIARMRSGNVW